MKRDEVPGCPDIGGIDRLIQPDPDDSISRLAKMHRQGVARDIDGMEVVPDDRFPARMGYGTNLTERDVANRCHERRWVLNPYFSVPVALGLVCLFAWDWVRGLVGRVL